MSAYVLIILIGMRDSNTYRVYEPKAAAMQEFSSKETCDAAASIMQVGKDEDGLKAYYVRK